MISFVFSDANVQFPSVRSAVSNMPNVSSGMALKVSRCRGDDMLMNFDCTPFSRFTKKKKESLIFGGASVLRLISIRRLEFGSWARSAHLKEFLVPMEALFSMMRGITLKNKQILNDEKSQRNLRWIIADLLRSMMLKEDANSDDEFRTPQYIREWALFYMKKEITNQIPVQLLYHAITRENHGLQCILKAKDSETLSIGNIAALFSNSDTITIYIADADDIRDSEWKSLVNGSSKVIEIGVTTAIQFQFALTVERRKQKRLFDLAFGSLPETGFEWKHDVRGNMLTFQVKHEEKSESERSETFGKHIEVMLESLEIVNTVFAKRDAAALIMQSFFRRHGHLLRSELSELRIRRALFVLWTSYRCRQLRHSLQQWLDRRVEDTRKRKEEERKRREEEERQRKLEEERRLAALKEDERKKEEV